MGGVTNLLTPKMLYTGQPGTTDTLLYTNVPRQSEGTVIRSIVVTNTTAGAATITLALNAGAAMVAAEHLLSAYSVAANQTAVFDAFMVVNAGETIRALQGTSAAITVSIFGEDQ